MSVHDFSPSLSRLLAIVLLGSDGNDLRPISIVHALLLFLSHEHVSECENLALRTARKTTVSAFRVTNLLRAGSRLSSRAGIWNSTQNLFPNMIAEISRNIPEMPCLGSLHARELATSSQLNFLLPPPVDSIDHDPLINVADRLTFDLFSADSTDHSNGTDRLRSTAPEPEAENGDAGNVRGQGETHFYFAYRKSV